MDNIRVVIVYSYKLEYISVDGMEMKNIDVIQDRVIPEWFEPSNGRDGWEGLIEEIYKMADDREAKPSFEFQGPVESKHIFEECIGERGFGMNAKSPLEIGKDNMKDAKRAEHIGLYKKAFQCYLNAAEYGGITEAKYKVAEYYYNHYQGANNGVMADAETSLMNAVEYYEAAADDGDWQANYRLYEMFFYGDGVRKDCQEAMKWLEGAAECGYVVAQRLLGDFYKKGEWVEKNQKTAYNWFRKSAEQGDAEAQYLFGTCYYEGQGVDRNEEEAVKWYRKAAGQGIKEAQVLLGICYYNGEGVEKNYEESVKWYQKAAEQGQMDAQYCLGICYYNGEGVETNEEEAVKWYQKAAKQGHDGAQKALKNSYFDSYQKTEEQGYVKSQVRLEDTKAIKCYQERIEKNLSYEESRKWYRKAAGQGQRDAQTVMGIFYYFGEEGVTKNYVEAFIWFREAAGRGQMDAQYYMGECYYNGYGVGNNFEEARKWYQKAAEQGHNGAQKVLKNCYDLYQKSEEQRYDKMQQYLNTIYHNGKIVFNFSVSQQSGLNTNNHSENREEIGKVRKEAEQGDREAQYQLGNYYYGVEDYKEAVKWYRKAADQGHRDAQYYVGECYYLGLGVKQSSAEAGRWYRKAEEQGQGKARFKVC